MLQWPVSVDWQCPDCESQILMFLSKLALAICFPSGLHATDLTLYLRWSGHESTETKRKNLRKKLTCPSARSAGTRKRTYLYLLNYYHFRSYICQINPPFRVTDLTSTHKRSQYSWAVACSNWVSSGGCGFLLAVS